MSGRYVISYRVFLFVGMAVVIYFSTALAATYTRDMTIPGDYTLSNSSLVEITNGV
ncbi:MAG: hypothetical protein H6766_01445 [Candidatus Peribacteria bacterium]|nr:MAG: hypothetical protein H6766_01445 [Candidatus Peribacteria bacterium]